jgi:hypothetical protein
MTEGMKDGSPSTIGTMAYEASSGERVSHPASPYPWEELMLRLVMFVVFRFVVFRFLLGEEQL